MGLFSYRDENRGQIRQNQPLSANVFPPEGRRKGARADDPRRAQGGCAGKKRAARAAADSPMAPWTGYRLTRLVSSRALSRKAATAKPRLIRVAGRDCSIISPTVT